LNELRFIRFSYRMQSPARVKNCLHCLIIKIKMRLVILAVIFCIGCSYPSEPEKVRDISGLWIEDSLNRHLVFEYVQHGNKFEGRNLWDSEADSIIRTGEIHGTQITIQQTSFYPSWIVRYTIKAVLENDSLMTGTIDCNPFKSEKK